MKVRSKDEILICLIDILSKDALKHHVMDDEWEIEVDVHNEILDKGWVECLKWVLSLTKEEKNVFKENNVVRISDVNKEISDMLETKLYNPIKPAKEKKDNDKIGAEPYPKYDEEKKEYKYPNKKKNSHGIK